MQRIGRWGDCEAACGTYVALVKIAGALAGRTFWLLAFGMVGEVGEAEASAESAWEFGRGFAKLCERTALLLPFKLSIFSAASPLSFDLMYWERSRYDSIFRLTAVAAWMLGGGARKMPIRKGRGSAKWRTCHAKEKRGWASLLWPSNSYL